MACRFCGKPCGEREFCDEVCFEEHAEAMEEFFRWSAALPTDPPMNLAMSGAVPVAITPNKGNRPPL